MELIKVYGLFFWSFLRFMDFCWGFYRGEWIKLVSFLVIEVLAYAK